MTRAASIWLLSAAGVCASLGVGLAASDGYHAGFLLLNQWASAYPAWLWQLLTLGGNEWIALILILFLGWRHPRFLWGAVIAALIAALYSRGLKELIDANRPPAVLAPETFNLIGDALRRASFPSGHSVTAGVLCGLFIIRTHLSEMRLLLLLLAGLIGMSRIALGVHWPIDVAAGLAGGLCAVWLGYWLTARTGFIDKDY